MFLLFKYLTILFFFSVTTTNLLANSNNLYLPNLSDLNGYHLDEVDDLLESLKKIKNMRGYGTNIYKKIAPSTVLIRSNMGIGSGVLISNDGLIITNFHVIETNNNSYKNNLSITFCHSDGSNMGGAKIYYAKTIKIDQSKDLALLKLNSLPEYNEAVKIDFLGKSIQIGMDVHAIGHPNENICSYNKGYISQVREDFRWNYPGESLNKHRATVLQHQTPINPGNSGGPLLNDEGLIIGLNTFSDTKSEGIHYAISATEMKDFIYNAPLLKIDPTSPENNFWITKKPKNKWITKKNWITTECANNYKTAEDIDNNSINDTFGYDIDCDDIIDIYKIDKDEDGLYDFLVIDQNNNQIFELVITFKIHKEGKLQGNNYAEYIYDLNEDGKKDKVCLDIDMDQEIDHCRKIS